MRFIVGNIVYEFKVEHDDAGSPAIDESDSGEFRLDLKHRKFHARSRSPAIELHRSLRLPHSGAGTSLSPLMSDVLQEFEVPSQLRENMTTHLRFYLDRLSRRNSRRSGVTPVTASVDVREISPEKAAEIQRRMEERTREGDWTPPAAAARAAARAAEEAAPAPAKKSAVEALQRERVGGGGDEEERECGICLERLMAGEEVIRMPCFHVYHEECILKWLGRNHFCPFCHFKLPC